MEKLFSYTPSGIWNPQHLRFRGRNENIKRNSTVLLFPLLYKQGNYEQGFFPLFLSRQAKAVGSHPHFVYLLLYNLYFVESEAILLNKRTK